MTSSVRDPSKTAPELEDIPGIGPVQAQRIMDVLAGRDFTKCWQDADIYDILNSRTRAYMKYRPIMAVPRRQLTNTVKRIESTGCIVAGSWRRGADQCNDLDVLMSRTLFMAGGLERLGRQVKFIEPFNNGDEIIGTMICLRPGVYIFVDIFIYDDLAPYLVYATGSKDFNKRMRAVAKRHGLLLNQHGLFRGDIKIPCRTEQDIFRTLDMKWLEPWQRN